MKVYGLHINLSRLLTKSTKWHLRPAKTQISLGIRPIWLESSLSAWRNLGSLATLWAHSEDSDQTGRMPRLIWFFAGRTLILLVLSWGGSFYYPLQSRSGNKVRGTYHFVRHFVPNRTALNFGKQAVPTRYYNLKLDTYESPSCTIICSVKLLSFNTNYFLLALSDYLEHSCNRMQHYNCMSVLSRQEMLTESN